MERMERIMRFFHGQSHHPRGTTAKKIVEATGIESAYVHSVIYSFLAKGIIYMISKGVYKYSGKGFKS